MRTSDLLILPLAALWQQKLRTILTTLGVLFGAFVLAASLSIGEGVQETIARESRRSDVARRVDVSPRWNLTPSKAQVDDVKVEGTMGEARRRRLRDLIATTNRQANTSRVRSELDADRLAKLAAIPHVDRMIPVVSQFAFAVLGGQSETVILSSARPDDPARRDRLVAGRYFDAPDQQGLVVSEYLAYRLGLHDEAAVAGLIGQSIRLEFRGRRSDTGLYVYLAKPMAQLTREQRDALEKVQARLPRALETLLAKSEAEAIEAAMTPVAVSEPETYSEEFPVVGVVRYATEEERKRSRDPYDQGDADLLLPYQTATEVCLKAPGRDEQGVDRVVLLVDSEAFVKEVAGKVDALGVDGRAMIEFIDRERFIYLLIFGGMTCVAGVALLVSALGIANTMLMSVLERTREIGIMKAVGADNRHLQFIFLVEGASIGAVGGVLGLLLAWSASFPGDAWVRSMVLRDIKIDLKGSIFVFPPWIALTVLGFTVLVTTLAALYPARHASRVDPIKALRHE